MQREIERAIFLSTIGIMAIGLVTLYSATHQNIRIHHKVFFDQLLCVFIGIGLMLLFRKFDYRKLFDMAYPLFTLTIFLLILVLFVGRSILGAKRWIEFGEINFQPSELAKLALILTLARYFSQRRSVSMFSMPTSLRELKGDVLVPLAIVGMPMLLIFKQPDLGTAIVLFGIFFIMLVASGVRAKHLFLLMTAGLLVLPLLWGVMKDYQKERLMVFLNPNIDPLGAGYTIIQSKIAVGSGRFWGKGWFSGTQNQLNFLPERHTDFIFSVIGEEWGLLGSLILICCFFVVIHKGLTIALQTKERFASLMVMGIVGVLTVQVIVNIAMVTGLCPVVGITLPLVSYGRSSFMIFVIMVGILLSVNRQRSFL